MSDQTNTETFACTVHFAHVETGKEIKISVRGTYPDSVSFVDADEALQGEAYNALAEQVGEADADNWEAFDSTTESV